MTAPNRTLSDALTRIADVCEEGSENFTCIDPRKTLKEIALEIRAASSLSQLVDAKELYYLKSIKRQLDEYKEFVDSCDSLEKPSIGNEVLADNIDWLDCHIATRSTGWIDLRSAHLEVLNGLIDACTNPANDVGPNKTTGRHLIDMIDTIEKNTTMPIDKIARWTGFIQGVLCARGVIDVDVERDRTRPIFEGRHNVRWTNP